MRKIRALFLTMLLVAFCLPLAGDREAMEKDFAALTAAGQTPAFSVKFGNSYPLHHTLTAAVTGAPSACSFNLEGSLDATVWNDLGSNTDCLATTIIHVVNKAVTHVRGDLVTLTAGTSPTVTFEYLGVR